MTNNFMGTEAKFQGMVTQDDPCLPQNNEALLHVYFLACGSQVSIETVYSDNWYLSLHEQAMARSRWVMAESL